MLKKERQILLIVNDLEVFQNLERAIFKYCGFETETAREGEKALEMIAIGDMPPDDADPQPAAAERKWIAQWITVELKKIGRGPDPARLVRRKVPLVSSAADPVV